MQTTPACGFPSLCLHTYNYYTKDLESIREEGMERSWETGNHGIWAVRKCPYKRQEARINIISTVWFPQTSPEIKQEYSYTECLKLENMRKPRTQRDEDIEYILWAEENIVVPITVSYSIQKDLPYHRERFWTQSCCQPCVRWIDCPVTCRKQPLSSLST